MKRYLRCATITGAMATAICLATLTPLVTNEAVAQVIQLPGVTQRYYGYSDGYNRYGNGYGNYGYGSYRSESYGPGSYGYTGYGNGPYGYGYGSSSPYGYPTYGNYGYRNGRSYNLNERGLPFQSRTYGRIYNPGTIRYYSPYGYRG